MFDWDEDTLILLQRVFEDRGFGTTVIWDDAEARKLIKNKTFGPLLSGLTVETILRNFKLTRSAAPASTCKRRWIPSKFAEWVSVE